MSDFGRTLRLLPYFICANSEESLRWSPMYHNLMSWLKYYELPHDKTNKMTCAQRRLRSAWASAQSDQSSLSAWRKLGSLATHWAHSEDSDQTGRMPRLIWVFAGRTCQFVGFLTRRLLSRWWKPLKVQYYHQCIVNGLNIISIAFSSTF